MIFRTAILTGVLFCLGLAPVAAQSQPPTPNDAGDYGGDTDHLLWRVVDPNPNGLNCYRGRYTLAGPHSPSTTASVDVFNSDVVATITSGQQFESAPTPTGYSYYLDAEGLPWMFVSDLDCYVRANQVFVEPVF